ncbi:DegT/DnrJ/EryC1/StrS family aminotransferase [Salinarimonas sp. NSM]|uniref:DegT/DnrJ/EryC1/StrS family aminotransferase n=1 Tax=Salinarimonas sp. NSM TaxID=3458003 RepID=UPI004037429B
MSDWIYPLSTPDLGQAEEDALVACVRSGWLSTGPRAAAFEARFAELHGVRHAVAVTNGTAALHLAYAALGIGREPGEEVIQPSINFIAAANMTVASGATPVFGDIVSLEEPTLDPAEVEARIGPRTVAVVAMHYGGYPARMAELEAICRRRGLRLIEDACHAPLQTAPDGRFLGTIGDVGCFSFFSNKNMTCGEGGMVVTNDDALAARIRSLRSHGMTSLTWERHSRRLGTYDVVDTGFNYRMDDLRAALASVQLERLPEANARRRALARSYAEAFRQAPEDVRYVFGTAARDGAGAAHVAAIVVAPDLRDAVRAGLAATGIQTSLHYPPAHEMTAFAGVASSGLARSELFARSVITLPLYPTMPDAAPAEIAAAVSRVLAEARAAGAPPRTGTDA